MSIDSQKARLRETFRKERLALSKEEAAKKSQLVCENFTTNLFPTIFEKNSGKIFSLYLASSNEVDTQAIAEFFAKNHVGFCYPRIIGKERELEFIMHEKNQQFAPNQFYPRIQEPVSGKEVLPDLLILPLLAFDTRLARLGMGGGFYDRTIDALKKAKPQILTIGLAYEFQRARDNLPTENTDQRLDFIVTEKNVFSAS